MNGQKQNMTKKTLVGMAGMDNNLISLPLDSNFSSTVFYIYLPLFFRV